MTCGAGLTLLGRGGRELAASGDPYWDNVVLLLHFDGVLGNAIFTDSSSYGRTFTVSSGGPTTEASPAVGAAFNQVGDFTSTTDGIQTARTAELMFGATAWTIEFWIRPRSTYAFDRPLIYASTAGFYEYVLKLNSSGAVQMSGTDGVSQFFGVSSAALTLNQWSHVAISWDGTAGGGAARVYVNGTLSGTGGGSGTFNTDPGGTITVGRTAALAMETDQYFEDLRITKGVSRYADNFSVPASPYPDYAYEIEPPPTTIPPETYTDSLWAYVRFLSAMDLTKVNLKTSVAYTQDSAAVTATDPFDGTGALACVYPPESPTSTPFSPAELATLILRGTSGSCVEMWLRVDAWTAWTSGAYKWANLVQQDDLGGDPAWAVGIADELVDGVVTPCLQLFSHYIDRRSYLEIWRRLQRGAAFPVDGQWHHLAVDFRHYSGFVTTIVVYLDGAAIAALSAPDYIVGQTLQFAGQTTFDIVEGTGIYTTPAGLSSTTFDGALDEVRVTEASRYPSNFTVPHYAFPRS